MKRTDLIALIDRLSPQSIGHIYEGLCPGFIEGWDSRDPECEACRQLEAAREAVDFLRQIAQAQPVGWVANGFLYHEAAHVPKGWRAGARVLYELPLED